MSQRISLNQVESSERFYRIPKLFTDENSYYFSMKLESKFAYALLKDRFELSVKNKWVDEENNVFLIFTVKELEKVLGCGKNKVIQIKQELTKYGLLEEERQGLNKPNRLYVLNVDATRKFENQTTNKPSDTKEVLKSNHQKFKNQTLRSSEIKPQEVSKSNPNDTEYNDTEISETNNKIIDDEEEKVEKKKSEIISDFGKSIGKSLIKEAELNTENNLKDITYFNQYLSKALDNAVEKYKKFNSKSEDYFYIPMEGF
ncbi:replication initiator protein A [Lactococcus lactis]|uniref:replication initiator protein A n=1 Tax=Lactococcus lactis TaxID=1358 RepID=UPI001BAAD635|nr:replication initiator protein A [Lactococcus lactis]MBR8679345.1 replication initiator protein [Lactococcus lactis subsp. lactis]MBR8681705.1 replication initiator protein [Lactococcus lactis subsp. lactis]MBR8686829.1 replication initiator protein [Lactococcus lactis subsp. lactis]